MGIEKFIERINILYISGIYEIKNIETNKRYIGSAANLKYRLWSHIHYLKKNQHKNNYLQNTWNKYGEDVFEFNILLFCNKENLLFYEQRAIDSFESANERGYNIAHIAGSSIGIIRSQDYKKKMAEIKKGFKHTEEAKKKITESSKGNTNLKGHVVSKEHRIKISKALKGNPNLGKYKRSQKHKENASQALKGIEFSEKHKKNLSKAAKGRKLILETKKKISNHIKILWKDGHYNSQKKKKLWELNVL